MVGEVRHTYGNSLAPIPLLITKHRSLAKIPSLMSQNGSSYAQEKTFKSISPNPSLTNLKKKQFLKKNSDLYRRHTHTTREQNPLHSKCGWEDKSEKGAEGL